MTQKDKIKKVVFFADRDNEKELIKKALKNKSFRIPQKRATAWGWDSVFMRIYGTLNQVAKLLNITPDELKKEIEGAPYGNCRIQFLNK